MSTRGEEGDRNQDPRPPPRRSPAGNREPGAAAPSVRAWAAGRGPGAGRWERARLAGPRLGPARERARRGAAAGIALPSASAQPPLLSAGRPTFWAGGRPRPGAALAAGLWKMGKVRGSEAGAPPAAQRTERPRPRPDPADPRPSLPGRAGQVGDARPPSFLILDRGQAPRGPAGAPLCVVLFI